MRGLCKTLFCDYHCFGENTTKNILGILSCFTILYLIHLIGGFRHVPGYAKRESEEPLKAAFSQDNVSQSTNTIDLDGQLKRLDFVKQNVTEILSDVELLFELYFNDIKQAAELRTNNTKWTDHGKTKVVFNAYEEGYFEKVQTLPSVKTIFAKVDFMRLVDVMHTSHYHYGSTDCITAEKKGIYGKIWGIKAFNDTCHTDFSAYKEVLPLNLNYLMTGLPASFSLKFPQVAMTFMHIVTNAVVTGSGDVFVDQAQLLIQRCGQSKSPWPRVVSLSLYDEVFTIAQFWGSGFFHFTTEDLIRLGPYVGFLQENKHIKVHVTMKNGFTKSWLTALGISSDRLVTGSIRTSLLYMPAGTPCGRPTYISSQLLSMNLRQSLGFTKGPRDTVVVIRRSSKRYFKKHDEIWRMVANVSSKLGFQLKLFSDRHVPSLQDTAEMFQRAVLILGPHGAGLSNMLLSQPGTIILEGLCSPINLCYRNLAKMLGHRYVGLLFKHSCFDVTAGDIKPHLEYFLQKISKSI